MIITKLQGGLGNQLFQWATTMSYAQDNNIDYKFEISFYFTQNLRYPKLNEFPNIKFNIANEYDIQNKTMIFLKDEFTYKEFKKINQNEVLFLNGYWQSEKYFINNRDIILNDLSNSQLTSKLINTPFLDYDVTSMHIRRTDYLDSGGYHPVQTLEYYKNAVDEIGDYDYLFIFSDDINWCKNNLKFKNMIFMSGFSDIEDLYLMSMCKNNIIANSSFSWWGAWMNQNINKKIISPSKWFGDHVTINQSDIIPENWIKL
jgi:hypothetical protein